ncbi:MAG: PatU, partial [Dolichospermum sp.]
QLGEYPDCVEEQSLGLVPVWGWTVHQSKLNLPIPLPDQVFWQLLAKCQLLLTSSIPLGAKLVQVVESMFPMDTQSINDLAALVLRSSYRSADTLTAPNIESEYFDLLPRQQMALSLMAAKQLLENLTLPISVTQH